jgi:membrane protease YdiL (CAAX protease family)
MTAGSLKKPVIGMCIAAVLWTVMFSPWTAPHVNFWIMMTCSGIILTSYSTWARPLWWKDVKLDFNNIALGVLLAAALWGVFWVGDRLSSLMFDFARPQVDMIYGMKEGENPWVLTFLMLFIIGPAEEIFWRGFVQRGIAMRSTANMAFIVTLLIYGLVHIWKFNFMLIMAAFVCGFVWGIAYRLWPKQLFALIISHAVWDTLVFVVWPI